MHDGLVNSCNIENAIATVSQSEDSPIKRFSGQEPLLAEYVEDFATRVAGKLVCSGVDAEITRGAVGEIVVSTIIALEALRNAHYELWKADNQMEGDQHD